MHIHPYLSPYFYTVERSDSLGNTTLHHFKFL